VFTKLATGPHLNPPNEYHHIPFINNTSSLWKKLCRQYKQVHIVSFIKNFPIPSQILIYSKDLHQNRRCPDVTHMTSSVSKTWLLTNKILGHLLCCSYSLYTDIDENHFQCENQQHVRYIHPRSFYAADIKMSYNHAK
jgi:hypothetical protein